MTRQTHRCKLRGVMTEPGGRLIIKMSYQYRDPPVKDKTVLHPSHL